MTCDGHAPRQHAVVRVAQRPHLLWQRLRRGRQREEPFANDHVPASRGVQRVVELVQNARHEGVRGLPVGVPPRRHRRIVRGHGAERHVRARGLSVAACACGGLGGGVIDGLDGVVVDAVVLVIVGPVCVQLKVAQHELQVRVGHEPGLDVVGQGLDQVDADLGVDEPLQQRGNHELAREHLCPVQAAVLVLEDVHCLLADGENVCIGVGGGLEAV